MVVPELPRSLNSCFHVLCCERGLRAHRAPARATNVHERRGRGEKLFRDCLSRSAWQLRHGDWRHVYGALTHGDGDRQLLLTREFSLFPAQLLQFRKFANLS